MKTFNDNHAAMIRSQIGKGDRCHIFANYSRQIYPLLKDGASEQDVKIVENCLINQINFLKTAMEHYQKALETTQNILKK